LKKLQKMLRPCIPSINNAILYDVDNDYNQFIQLLNVINQSILLLQ